MTETQKKAVALVNEVAGEMGKEPIISYEDWSTGVPIREALCRTIEELEAEKAARATEREQHEAFRQEVSDAVEAALSVFNHLVLDDRGEAALRGARLVFARFIIHKSDPIAEAWIEATGNTVGMEPLNAALAARGLKIVEDK